MARRSFRNLVAILLLAGVYLAAGSFGLSLAKINPSASAVWPPTGIALAALLLGGYRLWPGVFVGAFLVNFHVQGSFLTASGIGLGNTLEAFCGAWLVQRFAQGTKSFDHTKTIFQFILLAAIGSTTISATIGVTTLSLSSLAKSNTIWTVWATWWLGDMVGDLIVAPLLLIWIRKPIPPWKPKAVLEAALLLLVIIAVAQLVFFGRTPFGGKNAPLEYLAILPLLWASFRFDQHGAIAAAFIFSAVAIWGTLRGLGPFAAPDANESLLLLQSFMGIMTMTGLVMASLNSERKRAEHGLELQTESLEKTVGERTAQLEEAVQELEAFSYSISHDMRAPLRAMQGYSQILIEDYADKLAPEAADFLQKISASAMRQDRLIQDVLSYSRVVHADLNLKAVDLDKLVREIIEMSPEWSPPRVAISIETPLPAVLGNDAFLTQCITNLLANAVKFVRDGESPHVRIWAESPDHQVRVCFEDNGIGIADKDQARIFAMFERAHGAKHFEGTGIGLAIVRKAVERMKGKVSVESEPGKGSKFWLELQKVD